MEQSDEMAAMSSFALVKRLLTLARKFYGLEKEYVQREVVGTAKESLPWGGLALAGLVFLALGGLVLIVTLILVLNIWLAPWASALIVTLVLMLIGATLGILGIVKMKKGLNQARTNYERAGEDLQWLKRK